MPLIILAAGILFLFFLIVKVRLNSFISLLLVAGLVGYAEGLPEGQIIPVIEKGLGGTLGGLAIVVSFGAMLGKLMAESGGALKQILIDSGVGSYIGEIAAQSNLSPLLLAWTVAAVIRIACGSATVAALTAGGIAAPIVAVTGVNPELMVLATGAGSLILSPPNDPGFWLFKEFFGLSVKQTVRTWCVLETIISVMGLIGVLALEAVI